MGGGKLLTEILKIFNEDKQNVKVITSKRQINENISENETLISFLKKNNFTYQLEKTLNSKIFGKHNFDCKKSILISVGSPWIFSEDHIKKFPLGAFNIHGARLPQDKGGGGFSWQIMQGKNIGFALIHQISAKIDDGKILFFDEFHYGKNTNPHERNEVYIQKTLRLFKANYLKLFDISKINAKDQLSFFSSYWPRLNNKVHGWINWNWNGEQIINFINAFDNPYSGAQTKYKNKTIHLKNCFYDNLDGNFHPFQSGIIFRITKNYIAISTQGGTLSVGEIYNENGSLISKNKFKLGERLFTPSKILENALETRVFYTSEK
ncbi:formyltransferase family protein [Candidatus Pelagibacter ubique]|nr:formyltransferase family protein [Candidatus Pelagibacter ubique]